MKVNRYMYAKSIQVTVTCKKECYEYLQQEDMLDVSMMEAST